MKDKKAKRTAAIRIYVEDSEDGSVDVSAECMVPPDKENGPTKAQQCTLDMLRAAEAYDETGCLAAMVKSIGDDWS